jgi:RNHCP domain-containing protein
MKYSASSFGDFRCEHCHVIVSSAHFLSGVNNRNHCPYCLWSCHLDLYASGDRLSACKGQMKPIGLTMKNGRNKYRLDHRGELMLIHQCVECAALSINRIAADDDPSTIIEIFRTSMESPFHARCVENGIQMLKAQDEDSVYKQLYGGIEVPAAVWSA